MTRWQLAIRWVIIVFPFVVLILSLCSVRKFQRALATGFAQRFRVNLRPVA